MKGHISRLVSRNILLTKNSINLSWVILIMIMEVADADIVDTQSTVGYSPVVVEDILEGGDVECETEVGEMRSYDSKLGLDSFLAEEEERTCFGTSFAAVGARRGCGKILVAGNVVGNVGGEICSIDMAKLLVLERRIAALYQVL